MGTKSIIQLFFIVFIHVWVFLFEHEVHVKRKKLFRLVSYYTINIEYFGIHTYYLHIFISECYEFYLCYQLQTYKNINLTI